MLVTQEALFAFVLEGLFRTCSCDPFGAIGCVLFGICGRTEVFTLSLLSSVHLGWNRPELRFEPTLTWPLAGSDVLSLRHIAMCELSPSLHTSTSGHVNHSSTFCAVLMRTGGGCSQIVAAAWMNFRKKYSDAPDSGCVTVGSFQVSG